MFKIFLFLTMLLFLNHCSIDTKTGMWENKKEPIVEQKLSNIKFNDELTFKEFKDNVIVYGKLSKFPKLDN
tara:strand:+ start:477 stop:689 length:213 start_codon:yes stop_codon:yes gene_type:complete